MRNGTRAWPPVAARIGRMMKAGVVAPGRSSASSGRMAQEYVSWLSRETGKLYRLLSEAEWEYVARAGTTTEYPWGDDIGANKANCDGCGSQWDDKSTAPVGSFAANAFGLFDTAGNVWEWVEDLLERELYGRAGGWARVDEWEL